jgi:D-3-phosphoglycerate dehydrogenase
MISENELELMKEEAILVNASRGEIINEDSLIDALSRNRIGGAGLDVYQIEPYKGPLSQFHNVVLTPHIASYAKEIRVAMELESVQNLIKAFDSFSSN